MQAMTLGGYTFDRNPTQFDIPKDYRSTSFVDTYTGVSFFSFGIFSAGQEVTLEWDWMSNAMFIIFQTLLEADEAVTWYSRAGSTYITEILSLNGKYLESALSDAPWRKDAKLDLLIKSIAP